MIVLKTSLPKGICYVETKNLDGETNMKHKQASKEALQLMPNDES
jgi:magnesium-transporting ATPase (P-type)